MKTFEMSKEGDAQHWDDATNVHSAECKLQVRRRHGGEVWKFWVNGLEGPWRLQMGRQKEDL